MTLASLDWKTPSREQFLARYWQRQPLVWRQALPGYRSPINPADLQQLACQDEADARLVVHQPHSEPVWGVHHGPFEPEDFSALPRRGWTLLVQAVDAWVPEVAELLGAFDFLPSWRLDDIMVSYAAEGGGVGPHTDQYDVFLLQAAGQRRWRFGTTADANLAIRADLDLRILAEFNPTEEAVLQPGDTLYLPPGVAHDGVALDDDCLTFSIGFRAPSVADLAARFADTVLEEAEKLADAVPRYGDRGISEPEDPTLIDGQAICQMSDLLKSALKDPTILARTIGGLGTEPRLAPTPADEPVGPSEIQARLESGDTLVKALGSRWAHLNQANGSLLCVSGECWALDAKLSAALCRNKSIDIAIVEPWMDNPALMQLLADLYERGDLAWHSEHTAD
ncbi:MAG: cupin domain-containing protein [Pseudomonadota bacterium]